MLRHALLAVARNGATAAACVAAYAFLATYFPPAGLAAPAVWRMSYGWRVVHALLTGMGVRAKFYFVWSMSEASLNAAGFGFSGFSDAEKQVPTFNRYMNTDIMKVWSPPGALC